VNAAELEALIERGWVVDHDNEDFYAGLARERLVLDRCRACGRWQHPPKPICPSCWSDNIGPEDVRGTGTIALWTVYRASDPLFGGFEPAGVRMVTVDLDEQPGLRLTSRFDGDDEPRVGMRVAVEWIHGRGGRFPVFVADGGAVCR
jgi:uncharacterized OB-fold protein